MKLFITYFVVLLFPLQFFSQQRENRGGMKAGSIVQKIIELEKKWNASIQSQDSVQVEKFLAQSYFLAVGIQGKLFEMVPRKDWLQNLKYYKLLTYNIDEIKVNVYGKTAVALVLFTQKALVGRRNPKERNAQFVLTDIWIKQKGTWRVAERHSSRPEQVQ